MLVLQLSTPCHPSFNDITIQLILSSPTHHPPVLPSLFIHLSLPLSFPSLTCHHLFHTTLQPPLLHLIHLCQSHPPHPMRHPSLTYKASTSVSPSLPPLTLCHLSFPQLSHRGFDPLPLLLLLLSFASLLTLPLRSIFPPLPLCRLPPCVSHSLTPPLRL